MLNSTASFTYSYVLIHIHEMPYNCTKKSIIIFDINIAKFCQKEEIIMFVKYFTIWNDNNVVM